MSFPKGYIIGVQ